MTSTSSFFKPFYVLRYTFYIFFASSLLANPIAYTYLDIEGGSANTSGAYVNTGYQPKYNSIIRAKFRVMYNANHALYCSRNAYTENGANKLFAYFPSVGGKIRYDYYDHYYPGTSQVGTDAYPYNSDLTLEVKDGKSTLTLDSTGAVIDGQLGPGLKTNFGQSTFPLVLLAGYTGGNNPSGWGNCFHGRFYYLQVYEPDGNGNEVLVHDYHPCIEDDVVKIIDRVTASTFAINQVGSGSWAISSEVCNTDDIVYTKPQNYSGYADGQNYAAEVTVIYPVEGATIEYSTDQTSWSETTPVVSTPGTHTVYYRLSADGFNTVTRSYQVTLSAHRLGAKVVYVAPTARGLGDGSSWANAAGSLNDELDLLYTNAASTTVEYCLARGRHKWVREFAIGRDYPGGSHKFCITGGYAGIDENEMPDIEANPTYLDCDVNGNDRWLKRNLNDKMYLNLNTTTDLGPFWNGDNLLIPDLDDEENCVAHIDTSAASDNAQLIYLLDDNGPVILSNLIIVGAGNAQSAKKPNGTTRGAGAIIEGSTCDIRLDHVTFVGTYANATAGILQQNNAKNCVAQDHVTYLWTYVGARLLSISGCDNSTFDTVKVKGVYNNGNAATGSGWYLRSGFGHLYRDCVFEKCYANSTGGNFGPSAVLGMEQGVGLTFQNCVFSNNWGRGSCTSCVNLRSTSGSAAERVRFVDCLFENNKSYAEASSGAVTVYGVMLLGRNADTLFNCTFKDNSSKAKSTGTCATAYLSTVLIASRTTAPSSPEPLRAIANCTFSGNEVALVAGSNRAEPHLARGVWVVTSFANNPYDVVITGCSFLGDTAGSDIMWRGFDTTYPVKAVNCLFQSGAAEYAPLATEEVGMIAAENCVFPAATELPASVTATDCAFADVPVGAWEPVAGKVTKVRRIGARFAEIRSAVPLKYKLDEVRKTGNNNSATYNTYYPLDAEGENLFQTVSTEFADPVDLADACNVTRPANGITIGAVQTLTSAAENGATLYVTVNPASAGTVTGGGTVQVVEKGDGIVSLTAVSSDPSIYTFSGWKLPNGTFYSTEATLEISALNDDLRLTASFSAPKVSYTFDLDGAGTFAENGEDVIVKELDPGSALTVPAFTIDDEHYLAIGWDVAPPAVVGTSAATFTYQSIAKLHRILRFDANLTASANNGSSWANAMTNLQEAIDLAGSWTGEIWMRQGTQVVVGRFDSVTMKNNVQILGGFEGVDGKYATDGAERAARDPKLHETVINGDWKYNNYWMKVENGVATRVKDDEDHDFTVFKDGVYREPEFERGYIYYRTDGLDNNNTLFDNTDAVLDSTAVLDGVTIYGCAACAVNNGVQAKPTIRNCRFVGKNSFVNSATYLSLTNCEFLAVYASAPVLKFCGGARETGFGTVRDCRFRYCCAPYSGIFFYSTNPGYFEMYDTVFDQCTGGAPFNGYNGSIISCEWGSGIFSGVTIRNCWNSGANLAMMLKGGCVITNCLFEGNSICQNKSGAAVSTGNIPFALARQSEGSCKVFNTCFRNNTVERHVGNHANSQDGNAAVFYMAGPTMFANCTFDGNTVTCESPLAGYPAKAGTILAKGTTYFSAVNTAFNGNSAADGDVVLADYTATKPAYLVNSILYGNGTLAESAQLSILNCLQGTDPKFAKKWIEEEPVVARQVRGDSKARKAGRNVYLAADGKVYFATDTQEMTFVNAADGASYTPAAGATTFADAFGTDRPQGKVTLGPVQTLDDCGFMMIVR